MADKQDKRDNDKPTIIVIKKKKGGHEGHHGGAWKVAYADFVTAMMAFFLLLWLLNATSQEQKLGISNYFEPIRVVPNSGSTGPNLFLCKKMSVPVLLWILNKKQERESVRSPPQ